MKGMGTVRKLTVAVAVCMAVACLPGYSEPIPEQVKERTEMLKQAIENNDVERAKLCIKLGADVNAKDNSNWTAIKYARNQNHTDIINLLRAAGATE